MTPNLTSRNPHEASIQAAEEFGNYPGGDVASPASARFAGQDTQYHQASYTNKGKGRDYGLDDNPYGGVVVPGASGADENHAYREYGGTRAPSAGTPAAAGGHVFWQGPTDEALHGSGGAGPAAPEPVAHAYEYAQHAEMERANAAPATTAAPTSVDAAEAAESADAAGPLPPIMGAVIPPANTARQSVALSEIHKQEEQAWREAEELRAVVEGQSQPVLGQGQSAERFAQEVTAGTEAESRPWEPLNIKRGATPVPTGGPAVVADSTTATGAAPTGLEIPLMPPRSLSALSGSGGTDGFHTPPEIPNSMQGQFPPAPAPAIQPGDIHPAGAASASSPVVTSPTSVSSGGKISAAAFKRGPRFSNNSTAAETAAVLPAAGSSEAAGVLAASNATGEGRTSAEYLAHGADVPGSPSVGGSRRLPVPPAGAAAADGQVMTKAQEAALDQDRNGEGSGLDIDGRPRSPPPGYHNAEDSLR